MAFTNASDRRVRRTRESLTKSLGKLLMERDLKDITVKEVCDLADVNRSTFYLHYTDIFDLYQRTEDQLAGRIASLVAEQTIKGGMDSFTGTINGVVEYLSRHAELYAAILRYNGAQLVRRMIEENRPRDEAEWRRLLGGSDLPRAYCYTFITHGCVGIILTWLEGGAKESPAEIAELMRRLVGNTTERTRSAMEKVT